MTILTFQTLNKPLSEVIAQSLQHCQMNFGDLDSNVVFEGVQGPGTIVANKEFKVFLQEIIMRP